MDPEDLVTRRWRRYGKDRLYVESAGINVGWWDLATDEAHPEAPDHLHVLTAAVAGWKASHMTDAAVTPASDTGSRVTARPSGPTTQSSVQASTAPAHRPWLDLAGNRAGAGTRTQAESARNAAPVKTTVARLLGVHTSERAWRIGAEGEEKVGVQLAKLTAKDARWRCLHAIPVGDRGSDIDHLVIGPGGVFTVNAKHHPKATIWVGGNTVLVNGAKTHYVRNARHEAQRAARLLARATGLDLHVQGLIVTVNAADVVVKSQPAGVSVTWRNNLVSWLLRHGDLYSPDVLDAVYTAARRSTTWQP